MSRAQVPTSSPPPRRTVMSRASICVSRMTSALAASKARAVRADLVALGRWGDLLGQALEGPVPASHHLVRDAGERDDRPDRLTGAGELERRHVALHAVVVGGQRGRSGQLDRAVLAHEPAAGRGRGGGDGDDGGGGQRGGSQSTGTQWWAWRAPRLADPRTTNRARRLVPADRETSSDQSRTPFCGTCPDAAACACSVARRSTSSSSWATCESRRRSRARLLSTARPSRCSSWRSRHRHRGPSRSSAGSSTVNRSTMRRTQCGSWKPWTSCSKAKHGNPDRTSACSSSACRAPPTPATRAGTSMRASRARPPTPCTTGTSTTAPEAGVCCWCASCRTSRSMMRRRASSRVHITRCPHFSGRSAKTGVMGLSAPLPDPDGSVGSATGLAGDVYLCHPFLVHAASWPHVGSRPRLIAQPPIALEGALRLETADQELSPVALTVRRALDS